VPPMTSITAATLSAAPAVSHIPPASFSLLPPRLAELLQAPACSGPPTPSSFPAIPTNSVGLFASSPLAMPAPATFRRPTATPASLVATNVVALHGEFSGGAVAPVMETLTESLARYGSRTPVSGFSAHGPQLAVGPHIDYAAGPAYGA
jgi:hypothetical protein